MNYLMNDNSLLGAVNELVLIAAVVAGLDSLVFPEYLCVVEELRRVVEVNLRGLVLDVVNTGLVFGVFKTDGRCQG